MRATDVDAADGSAEAGPPPYIAAADASKIVVVGGGGLPPQRGFGPVRDRPGVFARQVADDEEKAQVLTTLRDLGVCFSAGREWNPTEVFEWLRDQGLVSGPYRRIGWRGPGDFEVWADC